MPRSNNYILTSEIIEKYDLANKWLWPDYESDALKRNIRTEIILTLRTHDYTRGIGYSAYHDAMAKLKNCGAGGGDGSPCLSPICPFCMSMFRRWAVSHGLKAMEPYDDVWFVTWVPDPNCPPTYKFDPAKFITKFQMRIKRRMANVADAVVLWGYVELKVEPKLRCLTPHIHCFIANCTKADIEQLKKRKRDKKRGCWVVPKNRIVYRPLVISKMPTERSGRIRAFSYACKLYRGKDAGRAPQESDREESQKSRRMRREMAAMFKRHRKFGFTKYGYKKLLEAGFHIRNGGLPQSEMFNTLAGLSVHDMLVLRRMTRKAIDSSVLRWTNVDHLEGRARRERRRSLQSRGWSDI